MCGIAGIVAADRLHADERARLLLMRDVITHRGPDDAGIFVDGQAGLAHRRLSIVDLAAGHQPLGNEDGTIQVVFNGGEVARLWTEHRGGRADHRHRLWQLMMLELWFRQFIDQAPASRAQYAEAI